MPKARKEELIESVLLSLFYYGLSSKYHLKAANYTLKLYTTSKQSLGWQSWVRSSDEQGNSA